MTWTAIKDLYDAYAPEYDTDISQISYPAPSLLSQWLDETLRQSNVANKHRSILDLGCGTGQSSLPFLKDPNTYQVTGMDLSLKMMREAQKSGRSFKYWVCGPLDAEDETILDLDEAKTVTDFENIIFLKQGDWTRQLPVSEYDGVICVGCLDFVWQLSLVLQRVHSVLHSHGYFAFSLPETCAPGQELNDPVWPIEKARPLIEQAGFQVDRVAKCFGYKSREGGHLVEYSIWLCHKI